MPKIKGTTKMKKISKQAMRQMTDGVLHAALSLAQEAERMMTEGLIAVDSPLGIKINEYTFVRKTFDDASVAHIPVEFGQRLDESVAVVFN